MENDLRMTDGNSSGDNREHPWDNGTSSPETLTMSKENGEKQVRPYLEKQGATLGNHARILLRIDPDMDMAEVFVNGAAVYSGNTWDFSNGVRGLHRLPAFGTPESFRDMLASCLRLDGIKASSKTITDTWNDEAGGWEGLQTPETLARLRATNQGRDGGGKLPASGSPTFEDLQKNVKPFLHGRGVNLDKRAELLLIKDPKLPVIEVRINGTCIFSGYAWDLGELGQDAPIPYYDEPEDFCRMVSEALRMDGIRVLKTKKMSADWDDDTQQWKGLAGGGKPEKTEVTGRHTKGAVKPR